MGLKQELGDSPSVSAPTTTYPEPTKYPSTTDPLPTKESESTGGMEKRSSPDPNRLSPEIARQTPHPKKHILRRLKKTVSFSPMVSIEADDSFDSDCLPCLPTPVVTPQTTRPVYKRLPTVKSDISRMTPGFTPTLHTGLSDIPTGQTDKST